jgi:hypothetical protein
MKYGFERDRIKGGKFPLNRWTMDRQGELVVMKLFRDESMCMCPRDIGGDRYALDTFWAYGGMNPLYLSIEFRNPRLPLLELLGHIGKACSCDEAINHRVSDFLGAAVCVPGMSALCTLDDLIQGTSMRGLSAASSQIM